MDEGDAERSLVEESLDDHRGCMQLVAEVEQCLDRQPDREGRWVGDLLEKLPRLSKMLQAHFVGEEKGPLFRKVPESHPRFAERLAKLEAEHARILEEVGAVMDKAEQLDSSRMYEIRELNAQTQLMVARIRRHEAEENEILIEAHWEEVGVGD